MSKLKINIDLKLDKINNMDTINIKKIYNYIIILKVGLK